MHPLRDSLHGNFAEPVVQAVLRCHDWLDGTGAYGTSGHRFPPSPRLAFIECLCEFTFGVLDEDNRCEASEIVRPASLDQTGILHTFRGCSLCERWVAGFLDPEFHGVGVGEMKNLDVAFCGSVLLITRVLT